MAISSVLRIFGQNISENQLFRNFSKDPGRQFRSMSNQLAFLRIHIRRTSMFRDVLFGRKQRAAPPIVNISQVKHNYATEATIELEDNYQLYKLETGPETSIKITKEEALKWYSQMQILRRLEAAAGMLYKEKVIRGFCHLYSGEEAVAVGIRSVMSDKDNIITGYRCHGWSYLMGISLEGILGELTGRKSGCQRGKGGSMHMFIKNYFGGNGIVGAQVPLGTGVALACQYRGDGGVCIACYGDGAANQGQVFEAFNIACLWKLPVIYVCENNHYGMGTKSTRSSCCDEYYTRGHYVPGIKANGMNLLCVRNAAKFVTEYAVKNGPIVLELDTYRYTGHSMSDPGTSYRSRDEVKEVRQTRDPIASFKKICLSNDLLTEEEIKEINTKVKNEINEVVTKVRADPEIELKELAADVYAVGIEPKVRGTTGYTYTHFNIAKPLNST